MLFATSQLIGTFKGFNETPWGDITVPYALRVSSDTFFY